MNKFKLPFGSCMITDNKLNVYRHSQERRNHGCYFLIPTLRKPNCNPNPETVEPGIQVQLE